MGKMKIEWCAESHIEDPERAQLSTRAIPVVRLAAVDTLMAEAVWAMERVEDFHVFHDYSLSHEARKRAQAFLASPLVTDWRARQEGK